MNIDYQVFHPMPFGHLSFRPDFAAPHFRRNLGENSFRRWKVEKKNEKLSPLSEKTSESEARNIEMSISM